MPETRPILAIENADPIYGNAPEFKPITHSVRRGFNLSHTVQVICRGAFLIDGSKPNVCVRHTTKGKLMCEWKGPIIVMRQPNTKVDPLIYENVLAGDLRVAVDYFYAYGRK